MKKLGLIAAAALAASLGACQKDDSGIREQLDKIDQRLVGIETALKQGGRAAPGGAAAPQAPSRPDSNTVFAVPVHDYNPSVGAKDAKVTIVEGFEFACPFCQRVRPTMEQLLKDYKDDVRVVYKHFVVHPQVATVPAYAACAAGLQGKWSEMEELIWEKGFNTREFGQENMEKLAKEAGLDMSKFKADMDGKCKEIVASDQRELQQVGGRGTPAFWINGRFLSGARPVEQFKAIIDEELAKANEAVKKGIQPGNYYEQQVMAKGEKNFGN